jgi:hypothetical protein
VILWAAISCGFTEGLTLKVAPSKKKKVSASTKYAFVLQTLDIWQSEVPVKYVYTSGNSSFQKKKLQATGN